MAARDTTVRLRLRKDIFVRAAGFTAAGAVLCAALVAGSILRDPARALAPAPGAAAQDSKDQTRVAGAADRPSSGQAISSANSSGASTPSGAEPLGEWKEQDFTLAEVVDGRTLRAGGITIRLTGLELPHPDQVCRTLDDRLEQCTARAATQLELLTRSRKIACRYRMTTSSEADGSCRIGDHDLAGRMIRTGYAHAASTLMAHAAEAETLAE